MEIAAEIAWFALGVLVLLVVVDDALRTFVLPRGAAPLLTRIVFVGLRKVFDLLAGTRRTYDGRDRVMALYAPIGLLVLPLVWLVLVMGAFTAMFHALGVSGFQRAFEMSGSSIYTLGFVRPPDLATTTLAFVESAAGLALLALLIAYLPTIYGAFSRREALVAQLAARSTEPPTGVSVLVRSQEMERFHLLGDLWVPWQQWFAELEETHTSLGVLSFFRSPRAHRSWITSCGAVLDAASLRLAAVDLGFDPQAGLCVRSGFVALNAVAEYFDLDYSPDAAPTDPISISRAEFDEACAALAAAGIPIRADRDQAWRDFAGWRVNYDQPLLGLAGLLMAPYAPWSSDRSLRTRRRIRRSSPRGRRGSSAGADPRG
jgi:hypothetical protein